MEASPVSSDTKSCPARIPGDEAGGSTAVAYIKSLCWSAETVEAFSVNQDLAFGIFYVNAHFPETGNGGEAVGTFQKV